MVLTYTIDWWSNIFSVPHDQGQAIIATNGQSYKTFYGRNLPKDPTSYNACLQQAFPA